MKVMRRYTTILVASLCYWLLEFVVNAQRQQPMGDVDIDFSFHTVFGAECNPFFDWQTLGVVYSHKRVGVPGPITRILTCTEEQLTNYNNVDIVPTHVAPSWNHNPHNNDDYPAYNKPAGLLHWLQNAKPTEVRSKHREEASQVLSLSIVTIIEYILTTPVLIISYRNGY